MVGCEPKITPRGGNPGAGPAPAAAGAPAGRRSIALVGLMGVGKSTVGKRLAQKLGYRFVDADDEIEAAAGLSISEIFDRYGETHFRDGERRVIARLMEGDATVIATGGGAFIDPETRREMLRHAIVVWLDAEITTLIDRVSRRDHRPLLQGKDSGVVLRGLAARRNPIYAEAHLHVMSQAAPHAATVSAIIRGLRTHEVTT